MSVLVLIGLSLAAACSNDGTPNPISPKSPAYAQSVGRAKSRGIEDVFLDVETTIPGFGGFFIDSAGDVEAFVSDSSRNVQAANAVRSWFTAHHDLFQRNPKARILLRKGSFGFSQLVAWQQAVAMGTQVADEISLIDADESVNRVTVWVRSQAAADRLPLVADRLGIPREALLARVADLRVTATTQTTDAHRPTSAGFKIKYNFSPDTTEACTMGYNVNVNGERYFITASHCQRNFTGGTGMQWYQTDGTQLGSTAINPAWATTGCTAGALVCRMTDIALVKYWPFFTSLDSTAAETSVVGNGSNSGNQTIGSYYRLASYLGDRVIGDTLYKTGFASGTTKGPLIQSCAITPPDAVFHESVTCASIVQANDIEGDSGAPVYYFRFPLAGDVRVAEGVAWGKGTVLVLQHPQVFLYSPWPIMQSDLGVTMTLWPH
ncbi:MAG TPA: hypothetical protein VN706_23375 [Gemmatimonadaceae bacterium]|nr:hypothetical protein [Gemmatimonadaceae bacterium]